MNKEHLFTSVLMESAHEVALAREAVIGRHLTDVVDLEADLIAFGREWVRMPPRFAEHFAIVRRITAEADDLPDELYEGWQEAGPRRVQRVLAGRLAELGERGLLRVDDPEFAAQHLTLLVTAKLTTRARLGARALGEAEAERIATAGVRAFLHGYLPPAGR